MHGTTKNKEENLLRIHELCTRIELLLNPNEEDHNDFLEEVRNVQSTVNSNIPDQNDIFWAAEKEVRIKVKGILKREWERVKTEI